MNIYIKKSILFLSIGLFFSTPVLAGTKCFLAKENNQVIMSEGDCRSRHAPCSTFKIAISLMGYHEGLLNDEMHPKLPFKEGYVDDIDKWKQSHTPYSWLKNSCVWYSQVITQQLGMKKLIHYMAEFDYGNQDVSGDKGRNNGLTNSWLSSSLEISPEEQIVFLQKLLENDLPVSRISHEMTKNILFVEDLADGWKLYGKTGSGSLLNQDRTEKLKDRQIGWYIGWIQKENRTIIFAHYIEDDDKQDTYASIRARAAAKEKLITLIRKSNT